MISVNFSGNSIHDVAREAQQFASLILGTSENQSAINSYDGYRPVGVGSPGDYYPVDDGREWNEDAIRDWISRFTTEGKQVMGILARGGIIDPREEARILGWSGTTWAGVWTGPRRQAGYVMDSRGLRSWPYGHTYDEPRRLWMHEDIATRVLSVLRNNSE